MTSSEPGGFLHPDSTNLQPLSTTSLPNAISLLPQPRLRPLKSGGSKESSFIEYVDRKVLEISRRYEKRYNADLEDKTTPGFEVSGYENFGEVATDLEGVLDVVWMSGTRMISDSKSALPSPTDTSSSIAPDSLSAHHCTQHMHIFVIFLIPASTNVPIIEQARRGLFFPIAGAECGIGPESAGV